MCESIDNPCGRAGEAVNVGGAADGDDLAVAHRQGFGNRREPVERDDLPVDERRVGRLCGGGEGECRQGEGGSEKQARHSETCRPISHRFLPTICSGRHDSAF
jgi:hypothetical protein